MTIRQKQWQITFLGYYHGKIDGIWGEASKAATVLFQKEFALEPDGVFGTLTIAKSIAVIREIQKEVTDGKTAIDGLAGLETKNATAQWQKEQGLFPDGIAGNATRKRIQEQTNPEETDW